MDILCKLQKMKQFERENNKGKNKKMNNNNRNVLGYYNINSFAI